MTRASFSLALVIFVFIKRSLFGQDGRLSENTLKNELSDIKIVGQDNGQKGLPMALIGYARVPNPPTVPTHFFVSP